MFILTLYPLLITIEGDYFCHFEYISIYEGVKNFKRDAHQKETDL